MEVPMVKKAAAVLAVFAAANFGGGCSSGGSDDPVVQYPTHYSVILENDAVRVLRITYQPGEKTAMHRHPDGIAIGLGSSKTRFTMPDGTAQESDLMADSALYIPGGEHSPENAGTTPVDAILVEFKRAQPGTGTLPAMREGLAMTMLAEGAYGSAYRVTSDPSFEEPEGSTHDYDQLVIALTPAEVSVSVTGQAPKTTWARGDTMFIGRNVAHSSRNLSGGPVEFILVGIK
jgi:quercetin dioxygenase-like cupin family protein